jgi:hypothetical protein
MDYEEERRVGVLLFILMVVLAFAVKKVVEGNPWLSAALFFVFFQLAYIVMILVKRSGRGRSVWPFLAGSVMFSAIVFAMTSLHLTSWMWFALYGIAGGVVGAISLRLVRVRANQSDKREQEQIPE